MRLLPLLLFVAVSFAALAQDSTEIKLLRYRDLYDKGLISTPEYEILKQKELSISKPVPAQKDTVNMDKLRRTYKAQIVSGTLELAAGAGFVALFGVASVNAMSERNESDKKARVRQARLFLVTGLAFSGIGIYSLAKGSNNRKKYFQLSASPGSASLRITF